MRPEVVPEPRNHPAEPNGQLRKKKKVPSPWARSRTWWCSHFGVRKVRKGNLRDSKLYGFGGKYTCSAALEPNCGHFYFHPSLDRTVSRFSLNWPLVLVCCNNNVCGGGNQVGSGLLMFFAWNHVKITNLNKKKIVKQYLCYWAPLKFIYKITHHLNRSDLIHKTISSLLLVHKLKLTQTKVRKLYVKYLKLS